MPFTQSSNPRRAEFSPSAPLLECGLWLVWDDGLKAGYQAVPNRVYLEGQHQGFSYLTLGPFDYLTICCRLQTTVETLPSMCRLGSYYLVTVLVASSVKAFPGRSTNSGSTLSMAAHLEGGVISVFTSHMRSALASPHMLPTPWLCPICIPSITSIPAPIQPTVDMTNYTLWLTRPPSMRTLALVRSFSGVCGSSTTASSTPIPVVVWFLSRQVVARH